MTQLTETLWVSGLNEAYDRSIICNVTHILNVASELMIKERVDHTYAKIAVADDDINTDIRFILLDCVNWIDNAIVNGGSVLVHCLEGKSRSCCACLAYLCIKNNMTLESALHLLRHKRPQIDIYGPYYEQLSMFVR